MVHILVWHRRGDKTSFSWTWWRHEMETFSALLVLCTGIHLSQVNSLDEGQWTGTLMVALICAWINRWVNNREADDLRRHRAHYVVTVMITVWKQSVCREHIFAKLFFRSHHKIDVNLYFDLRQISTHQSLQKLHMTCKLSCRVLYKNRII